MLIITDKKQEKFNSAKSHIDSSIKDLEDLKNMIDDDWLLQALIEVIQNNLNKSLCSIEKYF
jgi:hypothetical protein